ncbi:MAG: adenylyl-sulfate kinase [Kiloniellales bacterium]
MSMGGPAANNKAAPSGALTVAVLGQGGGGASSLGAWLSSAPRDCRVLEAADIQQFAQAWLGDAAKAEAAILVVDAGEGMSESSRRFCDLLRALGIRQVAVAIDGTDHADFSQNRFAEVAREAGRYLDKIGLPPLAIVPTCAPHADELAEGSAGMSWYEGPSILDALDSFRAAPAAEDLPLRISVQETHEAGSRRPLSGRIETGVVKAGDRLLFSPSNETARVSSIQLGDAAPQEARPGDSVDLILDEEVFIERGEVASHVEQPPALTTVFRATLYWQGAARLEEGKSYDLKSAAQESRVTLQSIDRILEGPDPTGGKGKGTASGSVVQVVLRSRKILVLDEYRNNPICGRFLLEEENERVAAGIISMEGYPDQRRSLQVKATNVTEVEHRVIADARAERNGHHGGVLWFTGLSGSGKSTLAMEVEQRLFNRGYHVYVLDGDNVRRGLNVNLGFSPEDRVENIRRIGELATLFADAGFICITAFISPYQADRDRARKAADSAFHEIHIRADLEICEQRDPKGLYKRARAGEIKDFTGISAPYEAPEAPELTVDTADRSVAECVAQIVGYVEAVFSLAGHGGRTGEGHG